MNILVVAAHPDDEVLGCGGTIPRLVAQGHTVAIAILSQGLASRGEQDPEALKHEMTELHETCRQVGLGLGASKVFLPVFPDNKMDTVPLLTIIQHIESIIAEVQPSVVYTHHGGDLNIDHTLTFRAVMTACRPTQGHPVKEIYCFETPSATEWSFGRINGSFQPNTFVDITETLEAKCKAMEAYESERAEFPHPRSSKALEALAQSRGAATGLLAAEAFELVRKIC